ncbi:fumarylacetoacetate (FAA) hydrolase [Collimonas sp. OK607]|uniref:fumarylacetoacetate hydrolase family protein n=1 Tax=Collimonas sp. OK607 TaxID=1798194 RepID=UPI0008E99768|nr:fumarylacetoacetate hydrolase family protein [Collimonas sp. OK607]SFB27574.1 fumarylacetoacetate (FAA) hydrolase [Collimonas sp. OK607]
MKLATLKNGTRDGRLVVVSRDLSQAIDASTIAPTMQAALDNWTALAPELVQLSDALNAGTVTEAFSFDPKAASAPLPRAYQWCDGSAFLNHGRLLDKAFNKPGLEDFDTVPVMYQGSSDDFLGANDDVAFPDETHGIDFEGEFGVVLDDVPIGCTLAQASSHVKLLVQINDWSLRQFAAYEMRRGFGWIHAKPATSFSPVAITPDELGNAWRDGRVELDMDVHWNGERFGHPNGREMDFNFFDLIVHAARTRRLRAGAVIGSGTVSNKERSAGSACIAERRGIEIIDHGAPRTHYMRFGDTVRMTASDATGATPFGVIEQKVVRVAAGRN